MSWQEHGKKSERNIPIKLQLPTFCISNGRDSTKNQGL